MLNWLVTTRGKVPFYEDFKSYFIKLVKNNTHKSGIPLKQEQGEQDNTCYHMVMYYYYLPQQAMSLVMVVGGTET